MKENLNQTPSGAKTNGVSVANSLLNQQLTKITGITTSQIQTALRASNPYPARVFIREVNKNCSDCANIYEEKQCNTCQIPVFFRIKETNSWIKPKISKGSLIEIEGNWAEPKESNRPSFTCSAYQILQESKPLTSSELQTLIQSLLSTTLEKYKEWTNRKDFLFKKLEELKEIETLSKLDNKFLDAYLLLKSASYANYQQKHLLATFNQERYLQNILLEIEQVKKHIEAYSHKELTSHE